MAVDAAAMKAANAVRRVIQRVRLATPDNFDQLESELLDTLEKNLADLGEQFEKVQEDADKGLAQGRKRVEQLLEKREKEEAAAQRPKELLKELEAMVAVFEEKVVEMRAAAFLEGGAEDLTVEDAPAVEKLIADFSLEASEFTKSIAAFNKENQVIIKAPTLPPHMKKESEALTQKIAALQRDAMATASKAKQAVAQVAQAAKKQKLDEAKAELKVRIKEAGMPVVEAEQAVERAEKAVEPFAKVKNKSIDEMLALADECEADIKTAEEAVASARSALKPVEGDFDASVMAELKSWMASEAKRPEIRLGQMDRRVLRAQNLVRQYRREANKGRNAELVKELKPQLIERAKEASENAELFKGVEEAIKQAEQAVAPFAKAKSLPAEEMSLMGDTASQEVENAKSVMVEARKELRPVDETLDPDLQKELNTALNETVKKAELRLSNIERRLSRAANLVTNFKNDLKKKLEAKVAGVKDLVVKVLVYNRQYRTLSPEELFGQVDTDDSGAIDEQEFTSFFQTADREEGDTAEFSTDDLKAVFQSVCSNGSGLSKDAFLELSSAYMKVLRVTALTESLKVAGGKAIRQLRVGETLEVLEGPVKDGALGLVRVKVQAVPVKEGASPGWATVVSNGGLVFLKACTAAEIAKVPK